MVNLANEKDSETKTAIETVEAKYKAIQESMQSEIETMRNKMKKLNNSHFRVASMHKDLEFEINNYKMKTIY